MFFFKTKRAQCTEGEFPCLRDVSLGLRPLLLSLASWHCVSALPWGGPGDSSGTWHITVRVWVANRGTACRRHSDDVRIQQRRPLGSAGPNPPTLRATEGCEHQQIGVSCGEVSWNPSPADTEARLYSENGDIRARVHAPPGNRGSSSWHWRRQAPLPRRVCVPGNCAVTGTHRRDG